jgi:DNA adenine methylase
MNKTETLKSQPKPFLKWAGSKKWLIPHIKKFIPQSFNKYYEPFLGSGALFFALMPERAQLSDISKNLINTYIALREQPDKTIEKLKSMPYKKKFYSWVRDKYQPTSEAGKAARIIYLNRTCWNGLYRENRSGKFNVPIGRFENPRICDEDNLRAVAVALKNITLRVCDFEDAVTKAKENDFIFFDPPYITGHRNNGFHSYNEKLFKWGDQERLAEIARELDRKGCDVLITNASNKAIEKLYDGFEIVPMSRHSVIAADVHKRGLVDELIITNYHPRDFLKEERRYA